VKELLQADLVETLTTIGGIIFMLVLVYCLNAWGRRIHR